MAIEAYIRQQILTNISFDYNNNNNIYFNIQNWRKDT